MNSILNHPIFSKSLLLNQSKSKNMFGITTIKSVHYNSVQVGILYASNYDLSKAEEFLKDWLDDKSIQRVACYQSLKNFDIQVSMSNFNIGDHIKEQLILKALVYNCFDFLDESYSSVFLEK